jgi:UDP-N-acetylglucosamine--N-acetylmuramyl-(pentapeptide) pyrophosphoryl-undecaprenol N-acetylglucosamine transferase
VFVQWDRTRAHLSRRARVAAVGNPVRRAVLEVVPDARERLGLAPAAPTLLVIGGSQGARGLNRAVEAAALAGALGPRGGARPQVLHLAGDEDAARLREAYARAGVPAHVAPFMAEMQVAYSAADLALARAGGTTIAELA